MSGTIQIKSTDNTVSVCLHKQDIYFTVQTQKLQPQNNCSPHSRSEIEHDAETYNPHPSTSNTNTVVKCITALIRDFFLFYSTVSLNMWHLSTLNYFPSPCHNEINMKNFMSK